MATPLGHGLAGLLVYELEWISSRRGPDLTLLAACVFMAFAPDLDFLPGVLLGTPALYHQGLSHSLSVALVLGLAVAWGLRPRPLGRTWALLSAAYATHLALDWLGPDGRPPVGMPLLWPLSDVHFLSPVTVLMGVRHADTTFVSNREWLTSIFGLYNVGAVALEILLVAPFVVVLQRLRRRRESQSAPPTGGDA